MSFSPLQEMAVNIIVLTWGVMFGMLLFGAYFVVRIINSRAKLKASIDPEQRKSFYDDYASRTFGVALMLVAIVVSATVNLHVTTTLLRDIVWYGYVPNPMWETVAASDFIIMVVSTVLIVIVFATKPMRDYEQTAWHIQDQTRERIAVGEQEEGQKEPVSA